MIKLIPFPELSPLWRILAVLFVGVASTVFFTAIGIIIALYVVLMLVHDLVDTFLVLPFDHLKAAFHRHKLRRKRNP